MSVIAANGNISTSTTPYILYFWRIMQANAQSWNVKNPTKRSKHLASTTAQLVITATTFYNLEIEPRNGSTRFATATFLRATHLCPTINNFGQAFDTV